MSTLQQNVLSSSKLREDLKQFYDKPVTKVSFELTLSIATVLLFSFIALRPTINTMSQLLKEIEDKQVIDEALTRKNAALATAQEEYQAYQQRFEVFNDVVHENPSVENALFYLEYLVQREGIDISGLSIEAFPVTLPDPQVPSGSAGTDDQRAPGIEKTQLVSYPVQISFRGEYADILKFFEAIERVRPLFVIDSFNFQVQQSSEGEVPELVVSTRLSLYAYGTPPVDPEAAGGGGAEAGSPEEEL